MRSRAALLTVLAVALAVVVPGSGAADAGGAGVARATPVYPYANTFALHSLKGSQHTIFLDFDGNDVLEGSWSRTMLGMPATTYAGFDLDGKPGFSAGEHDFIQQVWRRVAEAYSPFDVDVTTQDPGTPALSRTSQGDPTYGIQVAITSDKNLDELACGRGSTCSGIASTGAFDDVETSQLSHQPAWVFAANTFPSIDHASGAGPTAAAAAHEAAHTFGLDHAASAAYPRYYPGHAHWFPIMGQTNNRAIYQWSKGEYAGATAPRDDIAGIAAGGAPLRTDDYPDHPRQAPYSLGTPATSGKIAFTRRGVIRNDADNDYFTFNRRCTGPMLVKATGIGRGSTVDLKLTVMDSAGTVLGANNPASGQTRVSPDPYWTATGLDASLAFSKARAGTYRVRVEGVGRGNPASTGYSGYGSVGQYTLTVTRCSTTLPSIAKPVAPVIGRAGSGKTGKPVNAVARWSVPRSDGGAKIRSYQVRAAKVSSTGAVIRTYAFTVGAGSSAVTVALPTGRYKFRVAATNKAGTGTYSSHSQIVTAR